MTQTSRRSAWRSAARAAVVAAAALSTVVPSVAARAQQQQGQPGRIILTAQNPWTVAGQDLVLGVRVTDTRPPDALDVAVTLCSKLNTRSDFALTLDARAPCNPIGVVNPQLSELPVNADGSVTVTMPMPSRVADQPGVYAARVELREHKGREVDHFVTHVISVPATVDTRLGIALVLPARGDVTVDRAGNRQLAPDAAASVATVSSALAQHPSVAVTIAPTPATLQLLAGRPQDAPTVDGLANQVSSQNRQVTAQPFVPVSLPAFSANGLSSEEAAQTVRGNEALESTLHVRADPRTWVSQDPLDAASVGSLADRGVDRVVLPESSLQPLSLTRTLTQPFALEGRQGRRVAAAASDPELEERFNGTGQPVLEGHRLLADLAVLFFDAPNVKNRAVVAVPPPDWRPDAAFLATVLDGLAASPIVAPMTLDDVFTTAAPATAPRGGRGALLRSFAPLPDDPSGALPATSIRTVRRKLDAFGSTLDRDNPQASDLFDDLERTLLAAESSTLRGRDHTTAVDEIERRVDRGLALVHMPASRSVTLTARQGEIPVTVLSDAPFPMHVAVQLQSDKLSFPNGATVDIPPLTRKVTTLRVTVQARTSGSFPLRVTLRTPTGSVVTQSRITVRSTATSGVGLFLSVGAGAFLILWWLRHARHGRRARQLVPA